MKKIVLIVLTLAVLGFLGLCVSTFHIDHYKDGRKRVLRYRTPFSFVEKSFYRNGQLRSSEVGYINSSGHVEGYFPNGVTQDKYTWKSTKKSVESNFQSFNENGSLFKEVYREREYTNPGRKWDKESVVERIFDENGLRRQCGYVELKMRIGRDHAEEECVYYDQDSKPILAGVSKGFYKNGTLMWEQDVAAGKRVGFSRFFYPNGQLRVESTFKNGYLIGEQKYYAADGRLKEEIHYPSEFVRGSDWDMDMDISISTVHDKEYSIGNYGYTTEIGYKFKGQCYGSMKAYDEKGNLVFHYHCNEKGEPVTDLLPGYKEYVARNGDIKILGIYPEDI